MSVLIKGMKMPKTCIMCWLSPICPVWVKEVSRYKGYDNRLSDCPIVDVPTPHGRLIDAGDAVITLKANKRENEAKGYILAADEDEIVRWIDKLPTIIEAEEEEDDSL